MDIRFALWKLSWPLRALFHRGLDVGERFPAFSLKDFDGRAHRVPEGADRDFTVLWFTNLCFDCRAQAPVLEALRAEHGDRVAIYAVSLLGEDETRDLAPKGIPVLLDPHDVVGRKLGLPHPPKTCPLFNFFVLDRGGHVVFRRHLSAFRPGEFGTLWRRLLQGDTIAA